MILTTDLGTVLFLRLSLALVGEKDEKVLLDRLLTPVEKTVAAKLSGSSGGLFGRMKY